MFHKFPRQCRRRFVMVVVSCVGQGPDGWLDCRDDCSESSQIPRSGCLFIVSPCIWFRIVAPQVTYGEGEPNRCAVAFRIFSSDRRAADPGVYCTENCRPGRTLATFGLRQKGAPVCVSVVRYHSNFFSPLDCRLSLDSQPTEFRYGCSFDSMFYDEIIVQLSVLIIIFKS